MSSDGIIKLNVRLDSSHDNVLVNHEKDFAYMEEKLGTDHPLVLFARKLTAKQLESIDYHFNQIGNSWRACALVEEKSDDVLRTLREILSKEEMKQSMQPQDSEHQSISRQLIATRKRLSALL